MTIKTKPSKRSKGYRVWHMAVVVPTIALMLQLMLGPLTPLPDTHSHATTHYTAAFTGDEYYDLLHENEYRPGMPEFEVLPMNFRGEMTGPLLASVLKTYFPDSTADHAKDLRDTLPPGVDPRMIVLLPEKDEPLF